MQFFTHAKKKLSHLRRSLLSTEIYEYTVVKYVGVVEELSYGKFRYVILACDLPVTLPLVVSYV